MQCDEIHTFVGKRQKHLSVDEKSARYDRPRQRARPVNPYYYQPAEPREYASYQIPATPTSTGGSLGGYVGVAVFVLLCAAAWLIYEIRKSEKSKRL